MTHHLLILSLMRKACLQHIVLLKYGLYWDTIIYSNGYESSEEGHSPIDRFGEAFCKK